MIPLYQRDWSKSWLHLPCVRLPSPSSMAPAWTMLLGCHQAPFLAQDTTDSHLLVLSFVHTDQRSPRTSYRPHQDRTSFVDAVTQSLNTLAYSALISSPFQFFDF
jgi:hypothetical protein